MFQKKSGSEKPASPPETQLAKATREREEIQAQAAHLGFLLREVRAESEADKNLASVLTRSMHEIRKRNETLVLKVERLVEEVGSLRRYRDDVEAAWRASEAAGAHASAELAASERARHQAESQIRKLREEDRALRKRAEELIRERDEAIVRRSDAVRSSLESIRDTLLDEL